jgi:phosphoribosylformimino-5-aminoimidazole carboxamide ribotide isomerase
MHIIPVLDIKNGLVVHAKRGQRDQYAPINSPLCQDPTLKGVLSAYLSLYPFKTFYLADLDAITQNRHQQNLIEAMLAGFPELSFWIDSGLQRQPELYNRFPNHYPVLGSEAYAEDQLEAFTHFNQDFILSLDFSGATSLGPEQLFRRPELWPKQIIIMNLALVGSNEGPDFEKLLNYQSSFPEYQFIAAGGIRNYQDLLDLKQLGINNALLASALHSGKIDSEQINSLL